MSITFQQKPRQENCLICKGKMTEVVRISEDKDYLLKNPALICQNKECPAYIDLAKVKGWVKLDSVKK